MEKRSPFRTALEELVGASPAPQAAAQPAGDVVGSLAEEPKAAPAEEFGKVIKMGEEMTPCSVLAEDLVITGSVKSRGNIVIEGQVRGDVVCDGKLTVRGSVLGNLRAQSIEMQGARVKGETKCEGALYVDEACTLLGNVQGGDSQIRGKIRGNVASHGALDVASTAVVLGDLSFETVELHAGAVVSGRLVCDKAKDTEREFDAAAEDFDGLESE